MLELRQKLREAAQSKPAAPEPQSNVEKQLAALAAQVAALSSATDANQSVSESNPSYRPVDVPTAPSARLDRLPAKSEAQMKAHLWLDIVVSEIKDHNQQADGDIWKMWALSPRMLKDISGVSQTDY